jgi:glycosyltransferase involved in cell wall biosynthesis
MSRPKLSVVVVSYNQEKYIKETLDSILNQKTDFDIEVLVADDNSSDNTPTIIQHYSRTYPKLIHPILRQKNLGVLQNFIETLRAARGDFIALCEGDDYWTDPKKLQKQVDFLESNPQFALCFHPVRVFFEHKEEPDFIAPKVTNQKKITLKELVKQNFIYTNSVVYRRQNYDDMPENIMPVDWYLHLYHAQFGEIGFTSEVMAAYRRHPGGIWWNSYADIDAIWIKHGLPHLNLYIEILKLYNEDSVLREIIYKSIFSAFETFIRIDQEHGTTLLTDAVIAFPNITQEFIKYQHQQLKKVATDAEVLKGLETKLAQVEQKAAELSSENTAIKSSKVWRLRNAIAKPHHKI